MTAAEIIDKIVQLIGTDASRAQILGLLNECYQQQVADSRWYRKESVIGTTAAGTDSYVVPSYVVEGYGLKIGDAPFEPIGEDQMWRLKASVVSLRYARGGGVFSTSYSALGSPQITVYPTPVVGDTDITLYYAASPDPLAEADTPILPVDAHTALVDGTAALVLMRIDERPDLAMPFQQRFDLATEKLRRRKNQLLRGSAPTQAQIAGVHF